MAGWYADKPNETLLALARLMRAPYPKGTKPGKLTAALETASEALFPGAPEEVEKWAYGDYPLRAHPQERGLQVKPLSAKEAKERDLGSTSRSSDILSALSALPIGSVAKAPVGVAAVVKPKGGSWVTHLDTAVSSMFPKREPWVEDAADRQFRFAGEYGENYRKRVTDWLRNYAGTAEDPLKEHPLGENIPYTWGDLGDNMVEKLRPEAVEVDRPDKWDDALGRYVPSEDVHVRLYGPEGEEPVINEKLAQKLAAWKDNPEGEHYMPRPLDQAINEMLSSPREDMGARRRVNLGTREEPNWQWEQGPMPQLNRWAAEPQIHQALGDQFRSVRDYALDYWKPGTKQAKDQFAVTFPDIIRKWVPDFERQDLKNVDKNMQHVTPLSIEGMSPEHQFVQVSPQGIGREGQLMQHCIGRYCDEMERGEMKAYSLRDTQTGQPHVTISTRVRPKETPEEQAALNFWQAWRNNDLTHPGVRVVFRRIDEPYRVEDEIDSLVRDAKNGNQLARDALVSMDPNHPYVSPDLGEFMGQIRDLSPHLLAPLQIGRAHV